MHDTAKVPASSSGDRPPRQPLIDEELADQLLGKAAAEGAELLGPEGLLSQVTKAVLERALAEEMTAHLGYEKHDPAGRGSGNSRNGTTGKTLLTDVGAVDLAVPRDRSGGNPCACGASTWVRPGRCAPESGRPTSRSLGGRGGHFKHQPARPPTWDGRGEAHRPAPRSQQGSGTSSSPSGIA